MARAKLIDVLPQIGQFCPDGRGIAMVEIRLGCFRVGLNIEAHAFDSCGDAAAWANDANAVIQEIAGHVCHQLHRLDESVLNRLVDLTNRVRNSNST